MKTSIASTRLLLHDPQGPPRPITVDIGRPYALGESEAACPVAIAGLLDRLHDVHGEDTLQALALAVQLVRRLLGDFVAKGGRLTHPDGTDFEPMSCFGV
jgi:hypothetical protein